MVSKTTTTTIAAAIASIAVVVAACGGGSTGPVNNPTPPPPPGPSPSPVLNGTMQTSTGAYPNFTESAAGNATVVFSCGCTAQAGTANTSNTGSFTLVADSTPTPSAPDPTYTIVPGRNYLVIATTGAGAEAWDTQFAGRSPNRNQYLNGNNVSDVYSSAVSLYVFNYSVSGDTAFDNWNFNKIRNWYNILAGAAPGPNAAEQQLLNDIAAAGNGTLYPTVPSWNPGHKTNATIATDLANVKKSGDAAIPTPCPNDACTGTPTP